MPLLMLPPRDATLSPDVDTPRYMRYAAALMSLLRLRGFDARHVDARRAMLMLRLRYEVLLTLDAKSAERALYFSPLRLHEFTLIDFLRRCR